MPSAVCQSHNSWSVRRSYHGLENYRGRNIRVFAARYWKPLGSYYVALRQSFCEGNFNSGDNAKRCYCSQICFSTAGFSEFDVKPTIFSYSELRVATRDLERPASVLCFRASWQVAM